MEKVRVWNKRDLLSIIYFIFLILCFAYYFGATDMMAFFKKFTATFSITETFDEIRSIVVTGWNEGSLGSTKHGESYESIILEYFSKSLVVIITAYSLALVLGITKGIFDFKNKDSYLSIAGTGFTSFVSSMPDFFMIMVVQWTILIHFNFIDVFGSDHWYNYIFPSLLVSLYPMMYFARITSATLSGEDGELYIQVARAKGLTKRAVIYGHILKKCLRPITQHVGVVMTYVVSNLLIVEWLTDYKGAAWRMIIAIKRLDEAAYKDYKEIGLIIEISLCFVAILFITQLFSVVCQNKLDLEKQNLWMRLFKVVAQYSFTYC